MQQEASNILVAIRIRPHSQPEVQQRTLHVLDDNVVILRELNVPDSYLARPKEKHYAFDLVLPDIVTQQEVFNKTTSFLIPGVLNGFNATVFAYGATGAGKTHTMIGDNGNSGIMLNTFSEFFSSVSAWSIEREYNVKLSYFEIYNEIVRDLLAPKFFPLDIREDRERGITISGLTELTATSAKQVELAVSNGSKRRTCESTNANEVSSRSHAVLQAIVEHREKSAGTEASVYTGKLALVDLAGSERAAKTNNRGLRLVEGANINKSLLALGNCINALCDAQGKQGKGYIPYRDSKLTRILKDSLGGNCRTVMIVCLAPEASYFDDTWNTLEYANRAKNIKTNVKRNTLNVQVHISKYANVIRQLKQEVSGLKETLKKRTPGPDFPIESYMIEISKHFKAEFLCKKEILQVQGDKEVTGFSLYSKQTQRDHSIDPLQQGSIETDLICMRKSVWNNEKHIQALHKKLEGLREKRVKFNENWAKQEIPNHFLAQLKLKMKYHLMKMKSIESDDRDQRSEALIKEKDEVIAFLKEQLHLQDNIIDTTTVLLKQTDVALTPKISSSLDKLNSIRCHSIFSHPKLQDCSSQSPHPQQVLHAASPTRIPKPASIKKPAPIKHAASRILSPTIQNKGPVLLNRKCHVTYRSSSIDSDSGKGHPSKIPPVNIAERIKRSPYISPKGFDLRAMANNINH